MHHKKPFLKWFDRLPNIFDKIKSSHFFCKNNFMRQLILLVALAACCIFSASGQVDLTKGLVLYLPFNGNTLDQSPCGNNATNFGATLTDDQWGNPNSAYRFNGKSSYMKIFNSPTLQCSTQVSLCARVKVSGFYDGPCYGNSIIEKGSPDFRVGNYILRFSTSAASDCYTKDTLQNNYYAQLYSVGPSYPVFGNAPYIKKDVWDCVIMTYDGTLAKMYVNGILRYSFTQSALGANSNHVFLGHKDDAYYPYWFNGSMDEVRIYNRPLNVEEIDSICSQYPPASDNQQRNYKVEIDPLSNQYATTSIMEEYGINTKLAVSMNQETNELFIGLRQELLGGQLQIFDMTGRSVLTVDKLSQNTISLGNLSTGLYVVAYNINGVLMKAKIAR